MSTTIVNPEEPKPFDFAAYKAQANEGKKPEPKTEAKAAEPAAKAADEPPKPVPGEPAPKTEPEAPKKAASEADPEDDARRTIPRSVRRELNQLRRELGEANGLLKARQEELERLRAGAVVPKAEEPKAPELTEPQRKDFDSDVAYMAALTKYVAKVEVQNVRTEEEILNQAREQRAAAAEAYQEQKALLDNFDEIDEKAANLIINPKTESNLARLFGTSEYLAFMSAHFVQHPEDWEKLKSLNGDDVAQTRLFHRIEGRMDRQVEEARERKRTAPDREKAAKEKAEADIREAAQKAKDEEKAKADKLKADQMERDAAKPKPSESASVRGGSAADHGEPPMTLADGKTVNPAWRDWRNERERSGRR